MTKCVRFANKRGKDSHLLRLPLLECIIAEYAPEQIYALTGK